MDQDQLPLRPHGNAAIDSIDWVSNSYVKTTITIPLQEGAVGLGRPVTVAAAAKMIAAYADEITNENENIAIEFGKETLLYLLAQKGCESLRFYFCYNHDGEKSLVAKPLDANGAEIILTGRVMATDTAMQEAQPQADLAKAVAGAEVGGGHTVAAWRQTQGSGGALYLQ